MGHADDGCRFSEGEGSVGGGLPVSLDFGVAVQGVGSSEPLEAMMSEGKEREGSVWPLFSP